MGSWGWAWVNQGVLADKDTAKAGKSSPEPAEARGTRAAVCACVHGTCLTRVYGMCTRGVCATWLGTQAHRRVEYTWVSTCHADAAVHAWQLAGHGVAELQGRQCVDLAHPKRPKSSGSFSDHSRC